jgi:hypothetical protein
MRSPECIIQFVPTLFAVWETLYNQDFKVVEFDHFKENAGLHTFTLSAKEWIEKTSAMGG